MNAVHIRIRGTVQGVGFRPFVYRLAHDCAITGWIQNSPQGVIVEAEGARIQEFVHRLCKDLPPYCIINELMIDDIPVKGHEDFKIIESEEQGAQTALVLPDIATCPDCLKEIFDPNNRRYLYPFTNCTHCGPRYSIIDNLPYDRVNTSMKNFVMCPYCQAEYDDPQDRRFHAQPNACPVCGPRMQWWDNKGTLKETGQNAIHETAQSLKRGAIVAVKGLGGFHLMVNACNDRAVALLRTRKNRPHKPLAVMFSSIEEIAKYCQVTDLEREWLMSGQAPIVLLRQKGNEEIAPSVAPNNPYLGAMLPCMPLHHILMQEFGGPLVATSGNLSDEPICITNEEARERLAGIADYFLVHNRPIVRQVDDSVVQEVAGGMSFLRRSRGYAPLPVAKLSSSKDLLALGAHQKNTVALNLEQGAVVSQHIGDLDTEESIDAFKKTIASLKQIYSSPVTQVVCDKHPDYTSTAYAKELQVPVIDVQHHVAHIASCMAEKNLNGPLLGVCFDGTGYGLDHSIWGGEFIKFDGKDFHRVGHLKTFLLPGGEAAVKEPRRSAVGLLHELGPLSSFADLKCLSSFSDQELSIMGSMMEKKINCPPTSSMGRLFDGISSIMGLCHTSTFEGQAAMALEFAAEPVSVLSGYPYSLIPHRGCWTIDWTPMVRQVIEDKRRNYHIPEMAAKFHYTLVEIIVAMAQRSGENKIVLTGGCFQNKVLTTLAIASLQEEGFVPYWHTQVPCNDGGIALGQLWVASRR